MKLAQAGARSWTRADKTSAGPNRAKAAPIPKQGAPAVSRGHNV